MAIAFNGLGCSLSLLAPTGDFGENVPPAAHFSHQLEKWAKEPFETMVSKLPLLSRVAFAMGCKGN